MKKTDPPVIVEQVFKTPINEVWAAITNLPQMKQWFFENIPAFEPKVGFETVFIVENEGRVFPHLWKITEVEPLRKIKYNWKYNGYAGDSDVVFELIEDNSQTTLKLTHNVLESFSSHIPEFTRESCLEGWNYFIKQSLKAYLEGSR